jgi:predicted outer membrane repeat protein
LKKNKAIDDGGVLFAIFSSSITVDNSSFCNNEAEDNGGVLFAYSYSSIIAGNGYFDNNEAGMHGGVMFAQDSSKVTVNKSFFDNNVARSSSGVMHAYKSSINVFNSSFGNNKAGNDGGVMSALFSSNITVDNSYFESNRANDDGGVLQAYSRSIITVSNSSFHKNQAYDNGGVMYAKSDSSITIENSSFDGSRADYGGALWASISTSITIDSSLFDYNIAISGGALFGYTRSSIIVGNSSFGNNAAETNGGVLYAYSNTLIIFKNNCKFVNNSAQEGGVAYIDDSYLKDIGNMYFDNKASSGGVVLLNKGNLNIVASSFVNNTATNTGGVIYVVDYVSKDHIRLVESAFHSNRAAHSGGVIALQANDNLTVTECTFSYNVANSGGVIFLQTRNMLSIEYSDFSHNSASSDGGVIYSADQNTLTVDNGTFNSNRAGNYGGVLCLLFQNKLTGIGENCIFVECASNSGEVLSMEHRFTSLNFCGNSKLVGNVATSGGAIFATRSQLTFSNGSYELVENQAEYGGAISIRASKLVLEVNRGTLFSVSGNLATQHGGGLYITMSVIIAKGHTSYITKNQASNNGGGIYASSSSIIIEGEIHLISNEAENGGAISLERYTKLQGTSDKNDSVKLISNRANRYGGALYIDDWTNPEMCAAATAQNDVDLSRLECFSTSVFLTFLNNSAGSSGKNLFGGLLDRCIQFDWKNETKEVGLASFQTSSNINISTIRSHPVRLCFCRDSKPDCNYEPEPISVNRGKAFSLQLIAYNQVLIPIRADVDIDSLGGGRIAGQNIDDDCTEVVVQFNLFTPVDYENLTLTVTGPCSVSGVSTKNIIVKFICTCPIGFQILNDNGTSCDCVCDQVLKQYEKTECNPITEAIIRRENFWISYTSRSNSSGYVIYPHCPFDYCHTPSKQVSVNLNLPSGSDAQCDSNRTGILCGTCKPGLSVSLGSSKCISCPTYWPGLLATITTVFLISGIGLIAFLLALNLTVAIGTLNAIIFYANIVAANKSAFFPSGVSPASVFISWLNFDIGFDVCFFNRMDTYIKTWLQLAFPVYIIVLVIVIIQLSYYFDAFGRLIGKKDPVATLATLILLSYAKLLQTIITAFSSAVLAYPDGSKKTLWFPDATQEYFSSKHTVLFFVAILILIAGLVYTLLLFSWQWFVKFPCKRTTLISNQKLSSFIDIYFNPYTPKQRYWTGLLLLVRVIVYLVSAFNPSGDPKVTLSATTFIMTSLIIYTATFGVRVYKNLFINAMEILTIFNIITLSIFTWYTFDADTNQMAITNASVGIALIQLTIIVSYHIYKHMNQKIFATIQESSTCFKMKKMIAQKEQDRNNYKLSSANENILLDMIDRSTDTDSNIPRAQSLSSNNYTQSVVELKQSQSQQSVTPPPPLLELTDKEPQLDSEQQATEQHGFYLIKNLHVSLTTEIDKREQCIVQSSENIAPFPADNGQQEEEGDSYSTMAEAKINDY